MAALALGIQSAVALELSQQPPASALSSAMDRAGRATMRNVELFETQSFRLNDGSRYIASLVSGVGLLKSKGQIETATCFLAIVNSDGAASLRLTIGTDVWEAETCTSVAAVGLIEASGANYLAILYNAASPNASVLEPVVFAWNRKLQTFSIDAAATKKASLSGASTVREIANSVRARK